MRPLGLILLLSCAYVGCASRPPPHSTAAGPAAPRAGGEVRVLVGPALSGAEVARSCIAARLTPGQAIVESLTRNDRVPGASEGGDCFTLRIGGNYPGGVPVRPADLIADWERRLRDPQSDLRWLLRDVVGVDSLLDGSAASLAGLRPDGERLVVCLQGGGADFESRLEHPALALTRGQGSAAAGPGSFRRSAGGVLLARPDRVGARPWIERIRLVESADDPRLLFRLREVDLAVVHGRAVGALLEEGEPLARLRPLERWDRRYYLWIDASRRWLNDPAFRVWLAERIDREGLVRFLFDGRGRAAFSLSSAVAEAVWAPSTSRPFASSSRPRVALDFDRTDDLAAGIASRIRATLALAGVEITLHPRPRIDLRQALKEGSTSVALLSHQPALDDPVLGLLESLWWLGRGGQDAVARLLRASAQTEPGLRADAAWLAEYGLLVEVRLVPLVSLQGWLASDPRLDGVVAGPPGWLELERAWWRP